MNRPTLNSRRRWMQFSLRSLLLVMVFACGFFSGIATMLQYSRRVHQAALQSEQAARDAAVSARMNAELQAVRAHAAILELEKQKQSE